MFVLLHRAGIKAVLGPAFGDELCHFVCVLQSGGVLICQGCCYPQTLMVAELHFCPPKLAQLMKYSTLMGATGVAGGGVAREGKWPWARKPGVEEGSLVASSGCPFLLVVMYTKI